MEQKQISIETEINELKELLVDVANTQIINLLGEADTAETAAELACLIPIIEDKLTQIAKTYPLCRDNTFAALPDSLRQNAVELKECWKKCEPTPIAELVTTIYTFLYLSTQRCIQLETIVAYQSINDHSTALPVTMEQVVTAIDNMSKVLQRVSQFVNLAISSNEAPPLDPDIHKNIGKLFEKINKILLQLIIGYSKSVVPKKEALIACVIKIARIMQDHQGQLEMNFLYLIHSLEIIKDALFAIARQLMPDHDYVTTTILPNRGKRAHHQNDLLTILRTLKERLASTKKNVNEYITWLCFQSDFLTATEMCAAIDQNSEFLALYEKTIPALGNTITLVTCYNHSMDEKIREDFEYYLKKLPKHANQIELVGLNELMRAIFERLEQTQRFIDQFTQQIKTPEHKKLGNCEPMVIAMESAAACASLKTLHCFNFFCTPKDRPAGFHIFCENQTGYHHLAHFYLICKDWSVPRVSTSLPENAINLILWWVLKFSTNEEKNQLYAGRTGGLSVETKPVELLTQTDKEKPSSCVSKFFALVQPVKEKKLKNKENRDEVIIVNTANNVG